MLKYVDTAITFSEIPDEITLCINLSNCPCHCEGCHSPHLAEDIGQVLTISRIEKLISGNKGITAICFMGGDNDHKLINHYAKLIKNSYIKEIEHTITLNSAIDLKTNGISLNPGDKVYLMKDIPSPIKVGWYSGRQELPDKIDLDNFDYIKLGPYNKSLGPLNSRTTNQRFYKVFHFSNGASKLIDITYKFWKHEIED